VAIVQVKEEAMRKLIVAQFISVDGVVEAPEQWHFPYVNEQVMGVVFEVSRNVDTMLLGRVTYQTYAGAFADAPADDPVGSAMNRPEKVVVSDTLDRLDWANSTRLSGDVVEQVTKLKEQQGGSIVTTGSITLVQTLLRGGLVDELNLLVHPIVVGSGRRLFESTGEIQLRLESCETFTTGVVHVVYGRP
jgi:dihydrofolate reductase